MIQRLHEYCSPGRSAVLFDPEEVERMLGKLIRWPDGTAPRNVRLERYWPTRDNDYVFEWSFEFETGKRWNLFGQSCAMVGAIAEQPTCEATLTADGIKGVLASAAEKNVLIHSPNCDPKLTHLATCLDPARMTVHLAEIWAQIDEGFIYQGRPRCQLLGYRPGRRAAILYPADTPKGGSQGVVGKMYRGDRASRLRFLHSQLNEQLGWHTQGRVRAPVVIGELPDLGMAILTWAGGLTLGDGDLWSIDTATQAVEGLAALHLSWIDGLPVFTIRDECGIVQRWQSVVARLHPVLTQFSKPVADSLLHMSASIDSTKKCLIHRDFYERQIIIGRKATTILDLDTLALGAPCVDLGNMLAHLYLDSLLKGHGIARYDALATALVNHYETKSARVDRRALGYYFASSLFRVGAVHAMRTLTGRFSKSLWALAGEVVSGLNTASDKCRLGFLGRESLRSYRFSDQARVAVALESLS